MTENQTDLLRKTLEEGGIPDVQALQGLDEPSRAVGIALESQAGRHWLRSLSDLDGELADRLLTFDNDFRTARRDRTLERVIDRASLNAVITHQNSIAAGPAASALWGRLSTNHDQLTDVAIAIVTSDDIEAAENTLYLLVLDLLDLWRLGSDTRSQIARAGLTSSKPSIRSLAAEYLHDNDIASLTESTEVLVLDRDERVRGLAWSAGFRVDPETTFNNATDVLGDESAHLPVRRSALAALGVHLQTSDIVELLALFVTHPEERLALDAANLLYRLHRHPTIATAAVQSPHQSVREIGQLLLDPYRGSPAAGGSRPGDPTTSDIFAKMLRQSGGDDESDMPG